MSVLARIPHTKKCFCFFSIPTHPTKTVQHCFAGMELDVYFQVLKLKKTQPPNNTVCNPNTHEICTWVFCLISPMFWGWFFLNYLSLIRSIFFSNPFLAKFSILLNVVTLPSVFHSKMSIPLTKTWDFFINPAEGADRIACSALFPLKCFWCGKLSQG